MNHHIAVQIMKDIHIGDIHFEERLQVVKTLLISPICRKNNFNISLGFNLGR